MLSVNKEAMKIVKKIIEYQETLNVGVVSLKNGATVLDMGINYSGGWEAARYLTEISMGNLGKLNYSTYHLGELELIQANVYADKPVIACLSCQLSGWALPEFKNEAGIVPLISGPVRALLKEDNFAKPFPYQDKSDEVVVVLQDNVLPGEELTTYIAQKCKVEPEGIFILVAPTGSLVGLVNVIARTLETSIWRLHELGFEVNNIISAWGKAPLPPISKDEYTAMVRANTYIYYGGTAGFIVNCKDEDIEKIIEDITLSPKTTKQYGIPFSKLLEEAGGNIFNMTEFCHNVTKVNFYNSYTGKSFVYGKNDQKMLLECL
ncbi:MAG TPA: methenyltetrahydromethanopterin cyclohydrolase [Candidatus Atribacteria bacterium]|uniref:Methenyltetrahydromethanopterin cyclohydrolase n=1 Tax=candidate division TA06 bacterium 34_109 TaxID=1635277 RepID=A0A101I086_UNCT6|nr:MAG: Methenyltetrahydromethanopterin cyclohydrolase [candidate division TA06 bacterium 34_109]HBY57208.1 methenyltetrahydromethanopterin cyclohydrolase [Candidatus Atribacteria bacterium]